MMVTKPKNILVADDEEIIQELFTAVLSRKGHKITTVANGADAVEYVKKNKYDLIFLDIRMPKMDGFQAFKKIRKIAPDIKIIMMSGYTTDNIMDKAVALGAVEKLKKPFSNVNLLYTIVDKY